MKRNLLFALLAVLMGINCLHASDNDWRSQYDESTLMVIDSIDNTMTRISTPLDIEKGAIHLNLKDGWTFLQKKDADYLMEDLCGNLHDESMQGVLLSPGWSVANDGALIVAISFMPEGYVDDSDADDIDYNDLEEMLRESSFEANKQRAEQGLDSLHFEGWAGTPYYDNQAKVLHWSKLFTTDQGKLLNYDVRILGRKGLASLNVIGGYEQLDQIKAEIPNLIEIVKFTDGNAYGDFNPDIDEVAAFGIGGLIVGKALAKGGVLVLIAKFWKIILVALGGIGVAAKKFFGRKREE